MPLTEIARLRRELKRAIRKRDDPSRPFPLGWDVQEVKRLEAELDAAVHAEGHRPLPLEE